LIGCAALLCPNKLFWTERNGIQRVGNMGYACRSTGFTVYANLSTPPANDVVCTPVAAAVADASSQQLFFWVNWSFDHGYYSYISSVGYDGSQPMPVPLQSRLPFVNSACAAFGL
jgi:hypothetical protein